MPGKKTIVALTAGTSMVFGVVDASVLNETPLERVAEIKNERVEVRQVGDVVEATLPWKGEPGLTIKADMGEPTIPERVADKRKKEVVVEAVNTKADELKQKRQQLIEYKADIERIGTSTAKIDGLVITATSTEEKLKIAEQEIESVDWDLQEENGFKIDFILNEKPDTNRFCQTIEGAEDYNFFYQPPLTPEEIADGAERPENVVGSYAVYHKTLKNHKLGETNYETGKAFHIYRPQVWSLSSSSTKEWAELNFENNDLCVTVPQDFLDKAEYPVRVDPTFGYESVGATLNSTGGTGASGPETAPEDGTITSMSIYGRSYSGTPSNSQGIYLDNAGDPDALIQSATDGTISATNAWNTTNISASISASTDYWLAFSASPILYYSDSVSGYSRRNGSAGFPNPWSEISGTASKRVSIYATYSSTGGAEEETTTPSVIWFD